MLLNKYLQIIKYFQDSCHSGLHIGRVSYYLPRFHGPRNHTPESYCEASCHHCNRCCDCAGSCLDCEALDCCMPPLRVTDLVNNNTARALVEPCKG